MARKQCRRNNDPGHVHELTFSSYRGFLSSAGIAPGGLVEAIDEARARERFDHWAHVIIPEHVHILIRPRQPGYEISRILWRIKRSIGRRAIEYLRAHAPVFLSKLAVRRGDGTQENRFRQAGGGYDRNVTELTTLSTVLDVIHFNPVRRGLVDRPVYAGFHPVPLDLNATLPRVYET